MCVGGLVCLHARVHKLSCVCIPLTLIHELETFGVNKRQLTAFDNIVIDKVRAIWIFDETVARRLM